MSALIQFEDATLGYGRHTVLSGINLRVDAGDFLAIVGPNGAGKTTLLKALLGALAPARGRIILPRRAGLFGYVPQREAVDETFPLTVRELIVMGRFARIGWVRRPGAADQARVEAVADRIGIAGLLDRRYRTLSGGQKQRALIARALTAEPSVLVLDEPTNGMDLPAEQAIMDLARQLHERDGLTVVMVSHLLNVVASYARRLAIVGEGRLDVGPVDTMLTAAKLSALYAMPVRVDHLDGRTVVLPGGPP